MGIKTKEKKGGKKKLKPENHEINKNQNLFFKLKKNS